MVKLIWDKKKDISHLIKEQEKIYQQRFTKFESYPNSNNDIQKLKNQVNWENLLFWGENLEVLYYLLNNFENKINLIYIDPPFFSGANYPIEIEEDGNLYNSIAYIDHWDKDLDSYLQMIYERLIIFKKLLAKSGLLFIHLDWHASHYIKLILDEIFGDNRFVNDIIWYYYNKYSAGKKNLPRAHDNILVYSKTNRYKLNEIRIPRKKPRKQLKRIMVNGVLKNIKDKNGHVVYRIVNDKKLDDVWKIPCLQPASKEWTGFPTQKHHELLNRIIQLGSNKGDVIADFFCGSGTTLLVADTLGRKWIGCDISKYSIYLTRKRIFSYRRDLTHSQKSLHPISIYTNLNNEHKEIINSGFFNKNITIRRKK
ncbi:MAG: DNA methyltransferase [Promethearchaeota archaeon]